MRRLKFFVVALLFGTVLANANPVAVNTAQKVAAGFYSQTYHSTPQTLTLAYTERSSDGQAVYYVFNVNSKDGFVIISAEDAGHPIIGSSNTGQYVIPTSSNNIGFWMNKRKSEITSMRANKRIASSDVSNEWSMYINNTRNNTHAATATGVVGPLCNSIWNQPSPFNAMCPGGSVTGCVATAMGQIMKYWSYPDVGLGSHCYYEDTAIGDYENYGELCATFDTSHYIWSAMLDTLTSKSAAASISEVAKLMYDCGVSVDMDYSPSESGAYVFGPAPSAQNAFVKYFNYDASTIKGAYQSRYSASSWLTLIEGEINAKRPVEYQGTDANQGGHTWVCDGYNSNNDLHMNWGWGGQDDGFYSPSALDADGYDFSEDIGALIGIEPPSYALAVPQISNSPTIKVYPNPSNGIFTVELGEVTGNTQISFYNMLGQEIYSTPLTTIKTSLNLGTQPKGVYLYRILNENNESVSTGRIVIQ